MHTKNIVQIKACTEKSDVNYGFGFVFTSDEKYHYIATNRHIISDLKTKKMMANKNIVVYTTVKNNLLQSFFTRKSTKKIEFTVEEILYHESKQEEIIDIVFLKIKKNTYINDTVSTIHTCPIPYCFFSEDGNNLELVKATGFHPMAARITSWQEYGLMILEEWKELPLTNLNRQTWDLSSIKLTFSKKGFSGSPLIYNDRVLGMMTLCSNANDNVGYFYPYETLENYYRKTKKHTAGRKEFSGLGFCSL